MSCFYLAFFYIVNIFAKTLQVCCAVILYFWQQVNALCPQVHYSLNFRCAFCADFSLTLKKVKACRKIKLAQFINIILHRPEPCCKDTKKQCSVRLGLSCLILSSRQWLHDNTFSHQHYKPCKFPGRALQTETKV
jgi:hypothetical protein